MLRTSFRKFGLPIVLATVLLMAGAAPAADGSDGEEEFGVCGESMSYWHPPVVDGCATGHEHGDAPPAWITEAGYDVMFHGHFSTSEQENRLKHAGMKGFLAPLSGIDIYFRLHAISNVLDRSARFHSYEIWARDAGGDVSHWQGWLNTGHPIRNRYPRIRRPGGITPPFMLVVDQESYDAGLNCEQWYIRTAPWAWNITYTICGSTTIYYPNEYAELDRKYWRLSPYGTLGGRRKIEASWPPERDYPTGEFVATQFGEIVTGMDDPRCSGVTRVDDVDYDNVCLEQYIAPTMTPVGPPDHNQEKVFDVTGVQIPNAE